MYGETLARCFELFFGLISTAIPSIESSCNADSANVIYQERIRGRSVQPIELSEPKVRRVRCKNLPYKEGFCRPHKTAIVALA